MEIDAEKMKLRLQTVEHLFGTPKYWMRSTHFLAKVLPRSNYPIIPMKQMTFADAESAGMCEQTRNELFLIEKNQVIPWKDLIALI